MAVHQTVSTEMKPVQHMAMISTYCKMYVYGNSPERA
jgi:hypothetical protein